MSWMTWVAVLVAWPVIGLGVAYLFGRFTGGGEGPDNASALIPLVVSYIRRNKRAKASSSVRVTNHAGGEREIAGGRRVH
jgi:hypothetical protein